MLFYQILKQKRTLNMKNIFFYLLVSTAVISCSKSEMQQTTDTIKQADSLFNTAKDGFKTLDSISKIVNDSAKMNSEIRKHTESVEKVIGDKNINIDSINSVLNKAKNEIEKNADVAKAIDSASKIIKESNNPVDIITTVSKTIEKVSKSSENTAKEPVTTSEKQQEQPKTIERYTETTQNSENNQNPIVKTGEMEVLVNNLETSKNDLSVLLRKYNGEIVTERFDEQEGFKNQTYSVKIPYKYFDEAVNRIPQQFGTLRIKNVESSGNDYNPNQMCDLEITLTENQQLTNSGIFGNSENNDAVNEPNSFFKDLENIGLILLGLLLLFFIVVIVLLVWLIKKLNRKNNDKSFNETQPKNSFQNTGKAEFTEETNVQKPEENLEDPYSKYKPN